MFADRFISRGMFKPLININKLYFLRILIPHRHFEHFPGQLKPVPPQDQPLGSTSEFAETTTAVRQRNGERHSPDAPPTIPKNYAFLW